jgi:hypothetical protein
MVGFFKTPEEKAEQDFEKAEQLFEAIQYKKAGKYYSSAGTNFIEIEDFSSAELSFFKAAKSYIQEERHMDVLESLRSAADSSLKLEKYSYAQQVFQKAVAYTNKLEKSKEKHKLYIVFSFLYYLCSLIKGEPEKGLNLIKKVQKKISKDFFKDNALIHLVTNLTIALRDKKVSNLEKIHDNFQDIELNPTENKLAKIAILLVHFQVSITPEIELDREEWTIKDLIRTQIKFNSTQFTIIKKKVFPDFQINELKILKVTFDHSDNLTVKERPEMPLDMAKDQKIILNFSFKPHFQKDDSFISPLKIQYNINDKFISSLENREELKLKLLSPPAHLDISIESLKPPLIDKTFPLEIRIENNSDSEARNLEILITLDESLKLMRGTLEKQIYSLGTNERINWKISAKPIEAGEFKIIGEIKYNDPDQNDLEERKVFPLSIKM